MHKSLPPLSPPEPQAHSRRIGLPTGFPAEFLLIGAAFLVLILG